jgi:DNA repair protein RecO (recombination protein O)
MKQIVTNAVVLRRINYQEADRIVTFLTSDQGKVTAMAKGVRKPKSKLAGAIELFGLSQITIIPGKSDMSTLVSTRLIKNFGNIVKDFKRTQFGYEVLKLVNKSLEIDGDEDVYDLLIETLESLNDINVSLPLTKFWFSLRFLDLMGHAPNVDVIEAENYIFDSAKMMFVVDPDGVYNKNHVKVLKLALLNNPDKLTKIVGIDKITEKLVNITQTMLIDTGFNPV